MGARATGSENADGFTASAAAIAGGGILKCSNIESNFVYEREKTASLCSKGLALRPFPWRSSLWPLRSLSLPPFAIDVTLMAFRAADAAVTMIATDGDAVADKRGGEDFYCVWVVRGGDGGKKGANATPQISQSLVPPRPSVVSRHTWNV